MGKGRFYSVHYFTGTERWFTKDALPLSVVRFLKAAPAEKMFVGKYPVIDKNRNVIEKTIYRVIA